MSGVPTCSLRGVEPQVLPAVLGLATCRSLSTLRTKLGQSRNNNRFLLPFELFQEEVHLHHHVRRGSLLLAAAVAAAEYRFTGTDEQQQPSGLERQVGRRDVWCVRPSMASSSSPEADDQLRALCEQGQLERAVALLSQAYPDSDSDDPSAAARAPSVETYRSLLKACTKRRSLASAIAVHAHLARRGLESTAFLGESAVNALAKCGGLTQAVSAFQALIGPRTVVGWTAVIAAHADVLGLAGTALRLFPLMLEEGVRPDRYTFIALLRACAALGDLEAGKRVHAAAAGFGVAGNMYVGTSLVDMYAKCGAGGEARAVFDGLEDWCRDAATWNAMVGAWVAEGRPGRALAAYVEMVQEGAEPTARTMVVVAQACGALLDEGEEGGGGGESKERVLQMGKAVHAEVVRRWGAAQVDVFVGNALVTVYAKCGSVADARAAFDGVPCRDVVSWNAMVAGYAEQGWEEDAIQLFARMLEEEVDEDGDRGVSSSSSSVVRMDARTVVAALVACGGAAGKEEAVALMDGVEEDVVAHVVRARALQRARAVHWAARARGLDMDTFVACTLISTYGKCGSVPDAEAVFSSFLGTTTSSSDVVPWNAMLAAYAEQGHADKALRLFRRLQQQQHLQPDEATYLCLLQACAAAGARHMCAQVHADLAAAPAHIAGSVAAANTLIHAYGVCSAMADAQAVFDALPRPSTPSWNALMAGYARQGDARAVTDLFAQMQASASGARPDGVTFLALLSACSHAGLVDLGVGVFQALARGDYGGVAPDTHHYVTVVDMLARAGHFAAVEALLDQMLLPRSPGNGNAAGGPTLPTLSMSMSLLGACQKHGNVALARRAFDWAVAAQPDLASAYVLMFNIYSHAGMWDEARQVNDMKARAGAWKTPGQTWIEHGAAVRAFGVGDRARRRRGQVEEEEVGAEWELVRTLTAALAATSGAAAVGTPLYVAAMRGKTHQRKPPLALPGRSVKLVMMSGKLEPAAGLYKPAQKAGVPCKWVKNCQDGNLGFFPMTTYPEEPCTSLFISPSLEITSEHWRQRLQACSPGCYKRKERGFPHKTGRHTVPIECWLRG